MEVDGIGLGRPLRIARIACRRVVARIVVRIVAQRQAWHRAAQALDGTPVAAAQDEVPRDPLERRGEPCWLARSRSASLRSSWTRASGAHRARRARRRPAPPAGAAARLAQRASRARRSRGIDGCDRPLPGGLALEVGVVQADEPAAGEAAQVDLEAGAGGEPGAQIGARERRVVGPLPQLVPLQADRAAVMPASSARARLSPCLLSGRSGLEAARMLSAQLTIPTARKKLHVEDLR